MLIVRLVLFTFEDGSKSVGVVTTDKDEEEMDDLSQGKIDVVFSSALELDRHTPIGTLVAKIEAMMIEPGELH